MCNHCKPKIKLDIIPPRAVVNGLETAPLLDSFSLQLIQTVIRLHPYSIRTIVSSVPR